MLTPLVVPSWFRIMVVWAVLRRGPWILERMPSRFVVVMRGYDMSQVDQLLARAEQAAASGDPGLRVLVYRELSTVRFRDRLRGYSRLQVDQRVDRLARELGGS